MSVYPWAWFLLTLVDGFERADIGAEIQPIISKENALEGHIRQLCQKLLLMLKSYRHAPDVIKATTELLSTLLNFSYDQGMMNSCCITWRCGLPPPPPPHPPGGYPPISPSRTCLLLSGNSQCQDTWSHSPI